MMSSQIFVPLVLLALSLVFFFGTFVLVGKVEAATEDMIGIGLILRFSGMMLLFSLTSFAFFEGSLLDADIQEHA